MIKLLILGPTGAMGRLISELALKDEEIDIVAACDITNIGDKLGSFVPVKDPKNIEITNVNNLQNVIDQTKPEVAVDFTVAAATEKNCLICVKNEVRCVIGTTALSQEFINEFENSVKNYHVPSVISPNMATGVNILFKMASTLTNYLADWDIEVIEAHHHRKIDAPSGTALKIGQIISSSLGSDFEQTVKFGRNRGPNKRMIGGKNELGFHSIRAGDIVGDHIILYAGTGERIEFKHQAHSRYCFAEGAIKAIKFIAKQEESKIFEMKDVLNL
ncbi:MAG: 4-hydroxy-tetrahydrodipicolinate reductase [Promethearchaeota archaeon]